jgi:sugar lactone lactonase YvrE
MAAGMPRIRTTLAVVLLLVGSTAGAETQPGVVHAPGEDAYVLQSTPGASHAYGGSWLLSGVGPDTDDVYRSFVRFPLPKRGHIVSAVLKGRYEGTTTSQERGLHAFDFVPDDEWTPSTLTWDNQPAPGQRIATIDAATASPYQELAIDVTELARQEQHDGWIGLRIAAVDESDRRAARWSRRGSSRYRLGFRLEILLDPVPGLAAGDVVTLSAGGLHRGVVAIDPDERVQRPIAPVRVLGELAGLAVDPRDGTLLSSDQTGLVRIEPETGNPSSLLETHDGFAWLDSFYFAFDANGDVLTAQGPSIVRVDATSGEREAVTSDGNLCIPAGLAFGASDLYVADFCGMIHRVLPDGTQHVVPAAEPLVELQGIVFEAGGTLLVAAGDGAGGGRIVRVDASDGSVASLASLDFAPGPLAVDPAGTIWVGSRPNRFAVGYGMSEVGRIDPVTGSYTRIWSHWHRLGGMAFDGGGALLVVANDVRSSPRVSRVDQTNGSEQVIAAPWSWPGPGASQRRFLVVDADRSLLAIAADRVVRIDPATGRQTIVAAGPAISCQDEDYCDNDDAKLAPDGRLVLLRALSGAAGTRQRVLWLDPATGASSWQDLPFWTPGLAVEQSGTLLTALRPYAPTVPPSLWRVDPLTGLLSPFVSDAALGAMNVLTLDWRGRIHVADTQADRIVRVAPDTGATEVVAAGARLHPSRLVVDAAGSTVSWGDVGNQEQMTWFDPATGTRAALATGPELTSHWTVAIVQPRCANGIDDDGDGLVDALEDPGCHLAESDTESPACQNGLDDDGDGRVDFDGGAAARSGVPIGSPDPDCGVAYLVTEETIACGLGVELVLPLLALRRCSARKQKA